MTRIIGIYINGQDIYFYLDTPDMFLVELKNSEIFNNNKGFVLGMCIF